MVMEVWWANWPMLFIVMAFNLMIVACPKSESGSMLIWAMQMLFRRGLEMNEARGRMSRVMAPCMIFLWALLLVSGQLYGSAMQSLLALTIDDRMSGLNPLLVADEETYQATKGKAVLASLKPKDLRRMITEEEGEGIKSYTARSGYSKSWDEELLDLMPYGIPGTYEMIHTC